jgi:hypothetical protein
MADSFRPTLIDSLPASTTEFFVGLEELPFNALAHPGDLGNAWFCAEASALTYKEPEFILQQPGPFEGNGQALWKAVVFSEGPTQAILLTTEETAVLAFRGTRVPKFPDLLRSLPVNLNDLMTDLSALRVAHRGGGEVHEGFFKAFNLFWEIHGAEILHQIGDRALCLTGHSLGGALATLAAAHLERVSALYTFGSPAVGNEKFGHVFRQRGLPMFRFVHGLDLVTTVPLSQMGYQPVGRLVHLSAGETAALSPSPTQHSLLDSLRHNLGAYLQFAPASLSQIAMGQLRDLARWVLPDDALTHHAPWNYCRKLHALARQDRRLP